MTQTQNPYRSLKVEFHILQSFPVTCLNRDDVGAPKTAMVGGTTRARVSSQCWKRQVRLAMKDLKVDIGIRTKLIHSLIYKACLDQGEAIKAVAGKTGKSIEEIADDCANAVAAVFIKKKKNNSEESDQSPDDNDAGPEKSDTLIFVSNSEIQKIATALKENDFKTTFEKSKIDKKSGKEKIEKVDIAKKIEDLLRNPKFNLDGLDIALFGRMVAQAATLNVEAAASFAHAISTHKVTNEVEFFTALDDHPNAPVGSAHMGSLEFNSATYYRYVSLDIGQLHQSLCGQNIPEAVSAFVKALYVAVPSARQTTQSGASPWEFAKVLVRRGQRLQAPFETAVKAKDGGFLEASKKDLSEYLSKKEKLAGSLFGKVDAFTFGEDENFSIDKLADAINGAIAKAV
jgi:CRISPR system Cascade subunit CasC